MTNLISLEVKCIYCSGHVSEWYSLIKISDYLPSLTLQSQDRESLVFPPNILAFRSRFQMRPLSRLTCQGSVSASCPSWCIGTRECSALAGHVLCILWCVGMPRRATWTQFWPEHHEPTAIFFCVSYRWPSPVQLRNLPAGSNYNQWLACKPQTWEVIYFYCVFNLGQPKVSCREYMWCRKGVFLSGKTNHKYSFDNNLFNTLVFPELLGKYYCTFSLIFGF